MGSGRNRTACFQMVLTVMKEGIKKGGYLASFNNEVRKKSCMDVWEKGILVFWVVQVWVTAYILGRVVERPFFVVEADFQLVHQC